MAEKPTVRMDRVERLIETLADKQTKLDDVLVVLAEAQIKYAEAQLKNEERFREVAEQFAETDRRFAETDRRIREANERMDALAREERERGRRLDERIDKLVSAIGEMLRTRNGGSH
jgi:flagellar biosynthesis/type III secretory pathway chaperone